ncbi:hypothetical protein [Streptomyces echinatus]|uniref:Uncharacterized protein n=1 Tax=Streptomyces echinatus TaxID=67293 RepID=A0A7W9UTB2_9ACTN|nr:hypothetical protein [Streptomyces echinatus]MBB5929896.1 hypothetical protein [Streptomyces echinatus]
MNHTYEPPSLLPAGGRERTYALLIGGVPFLLILLMGIAPHIGSDDGSDPGTSTFDSRGGYSSGYSGGYSGGYDASTPDMPTPDISATYDTTDPSEPTYSAATTDTDPIPSETESTESTESTEATDTAGPDGTVGRFFDAINERDYETAWNLGGKNLDASYTSFVSGYTTTERDDVTVDSVSGETVWVHLLALQTDGTQKSYSGWYTVVDGVITDASMSPTG